MKRYSYLLIIISILSCVGTDVAEIEPMAERIAIVETIIALKVEDTFQFNAMHYDQDGLQTEKVIQWSSSEPDILSISSSGLGIGNSEGPVTVFAEAGNAKDSIVLTVGDKTILAANQRTGMFQGSNGYTVQGTFTLLRNETELLLNLESDFQSSNGPGLYVYLSSSSTSVAGGVSLGELKMNAGSQSYEIPDGVTLEQYDFVLVYCQPFGVPFGFGQFEN